MRKLIFSFIICNLAIISLIAQQKQDSRFKKFSIAFEAGMMFPKNESYSDWNIRQLAPVLDDYYYYDDPNPSGRLQIAHLCVKPTYSFCKNKLEVSSGIRFTNINSSIRSDDPFYLLFEQQGIDTEYFRLKKVRENSMYLGLPIELKAFYLNLGSGALYMKIGGQASVRLHTKSDIIFNNSEMDQYEAAVFNKLGHNVGRIYTSLYTAFGFRVFHSEIVNSDLELILPLYMSENVSSMMKPLTEGAGFSFSLKFPFK